MRYWGMPDVGMTDTERVIEYVKPHPVVLLPVFFVFLVILASGFFVGASSFENAFFVGVTLIMVAIAVLSRSLIIWLNTFYVVTDLRIFFLRIAGCFRLRSEQIIFDMIKTMKQIKPSFFSHLFNYAHIHFGIDYYENKSIFVMRFIPLPNQLMQKINHEVK